MELMDVFYVVAAVALTAAWWRRCSSTGNADGLPPGPRGWPVVGNLFQILLQRRHFMYVVRDLRRIYGPIFTLRMGQRTLVIVTSADLIHDALIRKGPLFASRPPDSPTRLIFSSGKCTVNSATYGPLWRHLRRNLVSELVSPSRVRSFSWVRRWALDSHVARLRSAAAGGAAVEVMPHFRLTICSILACICFGARVPEEKVREIEEVMKDIMMMSTPKLPDFLPALTPLFRRQLGAARKLRQRQLDCLLPLVRARKAFLEGDGDSSSPELEMVSPKGEAYVDSLVGLEVEGKGPLGEEDIVTLCSEVMSAGTDTSATAVEWTMLRLVLDENAQQRVHDEVVAAAGKKGRRITEEDVERMVYLAAVVKETLRRHPPSHFVLSHAATRDTELGGYRVPAAASVEFYTAWLTEDPEAWDRPEEWRPERFLEGGDGCETDVTGTKGVRMMPFGVGRRICPAATLGMLHVQLMLATMIREFRWTAPPGEKPDPTETFAFTVVMKKSLRAVIHERDA